MRTSVRMRWDNLKLTSEQGLDLPGYKEPANIRHFDAPEALNIDFYEVRAKSAINRVSGSARVPFSWTINPYRGCTHACVYCFARPTHKYLDLDPGEDFERKIVVKVNTPEVLRRELARPSWNGEPIALGTNTDPYQWVEGRYKLMRGIWKAMRDFRNPCSILTKSPLLLRDLDLLVEISEVADISACLSVPTLDEKAWRATEPHTPHPRARLEAVGELNAAGITTGILIAPLMPGINDHPDQVSEILELASKAGAVSTGAVTLHLRKEVHDVFFQWLKLKRPDLLERYEDLYGKRSYAPTSERERIAKVVREQRKKFAFPYRSRYRDRLKHQAKTESPLPVQEKLF